MMMKNLGMSVNRTFLLKIIMCTVISCSLLSCSLRSNAETNEVITDGIFKFSIKINAKPEKIWPLLFQVENWKWVGEHKDIHLSGDREGGIVALYGGDGTGKPVLFTKTLDIEEYQYYGFSIYSAEDRFLGFGAFRLEEENMQTHVSYRIYLHHSPGVMTQQEAMEFNDNRRIGMEARQPRELARLKRLAEESR